MVSRDISAPISVHPYPPGAVPAAAAVPNAVMAGTTLDPSAETVPVMAPDNASVVYLDVRKSPSQKGPDMMHHSPRTSMGLTAADVPPALLPPKGDRVMVTLMKLSTANEHAWLTIGSTAESMGDSPRALGSYESALLHNPYSVSALSAIANVYRSMDHFDLAVEYFQRVLDIDNENGEVWGAMGHCYLMMDELEKAYAAYHQALYHLPNPKEPKLWYGIGILYDRYGSLEHAEETFSSVVRMNPDYEKANEIYFRLGIIYKQQGKYETSLECFRLILGNPPKPLTEMDIWFQIGHVHEQQHAYDLAREAYERVLSENTDHAKVRQQLGLLYMQPKASFFSQEKALELLQQSLECDPNDQQTWFLVGRSYMEMQEYNKAYDAYQQAVYRDGKNPALWCSIGILYFQIMQFHDALGAFSRSIRLNPYIPEIWLNLGILYETCNNQISDAIDAYRRVMELEPENAAIQQRLQLLQNAEPLGKAVPNIPKPKDVPLDSYATVNAAAPDTPSAASFKAEDNTWKISSSTSADPSAEVSVPVREVHSEDERKQILDAPPHRAYISASRSLNGPSTFARSYAETDRADVSHPRTHEAPLEWDRQYSVPYVDERAGVYSSRIPMTSSHHYYDGRISRYDSDGYRGGRPYVPVTSTRLSPLERRTFVSPSQEREILDGDRDSTFHGKQEVSRIRSELPVRGIHSEVRLAPAEPGVSSMSRGSDSASNAREVDEDYDKGAASALMGLVGAANTAYEASSWGRARSEAPIRARSPTSTKRAGDHDRPSLEAKRRRYEDLYTYEDRIERPDGRVMISAAREG